MKTSRWTQFTWHVHRVIQEAFVRNEGAEPEAIARFLLKRLKHRPNLAAERSKLEQFVTKERGIKQLLHFTHVSNVPKILSFGIVPRAHLTIPAVRLAVNPVFSDQHRLDGHLDKNCLSMSFPNYGMFYRKRQRRDGDWAVLKINPYLIADRYCEFSPSNAARTDIATRSGIEGARLLFCNCGLRRELGLYRYEPTDPQAEVLEDSVIEPRFILDVAVETASAHEKLTKAGISSRVEPELFLQRRDHLYWLNHRLCTPEFDYPEVLAHELAQDLEESIA